MDLNVLIFIVYLLVSGNTTYFLGRTLYKNGEHFLSSIFLYKPEMVHPVNNLLLVGFYLVNLGFVLLFFNQDRSLIDLRATVEFLAEKIGVVYLVLGTMHLFNICVFMIIEKKLYKSNLKLNNK